MCRSRWTISALATLRSSYLHSFPIDVLKIDRSFISAMRKDPRSLELVRAIVSLGRNLGIKVIAEGVEEYGEAIALANLACDEGQGYYFARPLPEDRLVALVERRTRCRCCRLRSPKTSAAPAVYG